MSWGQDADIVEVTIDLPEGAKAKDIEVIIKYNYVKFGLKNGYAMDNKKGHTNEGRSNPVLRRLLTGLNLYGKIDPRWSTWALSDDHKLVISLAKREESVMWSNLYAT